MPHCLLSQPSLPSDNKHNSGNVKAVLHGGVEHGCRCNRQISLVISFNPLNTHNMTVGQKINTQKPACPPFFHCGLKSKQSLSPLCCTWTLKHRCKWRLKLDGKYTGKRWFTWRVTNKPGCRRNVVFSLNTGCGNLGGKKEEKWPVAERDPEYRTPNQDSTEPRQAEIVFSIDKRIWS